MFDRQVINVYSVANFNYSKTGNVLQTVFAVKIKMKKIKLKRPRRVLNPGPFVCSYHFWVGFVYLLLMLISLLFHCATATHV